MTEKVDNAPGIRPAPLEALASRAKTSFGRVRVPMSLPDDLVVFKAVAGRPKDNEDAEALLLLHPKIDVARARRRVAELAALAEVPELVDNFDAIAVRARGARREPAAVSGAPEAKPKGRRPRRPKSP